MSILNLNRRLFLRNASGVCIALPFLPSLANAQAATGPKFYVQIVTNHGYFPFDPDYNNEHQFYPDHNRVNPSSTSNLINTYSLSELLDASPNTEGGKKLLSPGLGSNFNNLIAKTMMFRRFEPAVRNNLHNATIPTTCSAPWDPVGGIQNSSYGLPAFGWSIDAVLEQSKSILGTTPIPAIRLTPLPDGEDGGWNGVSFATNSNGNITELPAITNTIALWNSVFPGSAVEVDKGQAFTKAADALLPEYNRILASGRLSAADKQNFQNYIDHINDIQNRLFIEIKTCDSLKQSYGADLGLLTEADQSAYVEAVLDQTYDNQLEILAAALHCGATNVASCTLWDGYYEGSVRRTYGELHDGSIAHSGGDPIYRSKIAKETCRWRAQRVAKFCEKLDSIDLGGSTLLDQGIVLYGNEYGSYDHDVSDTSAMIMGGNALNLNQGQYIRQNDGNWVYFYNNVIVTLMQALGVNADAVKSVTNSDGFGEYSVMNGGCSENSCSFSDRNLSVAEKTALVPGMLKT